MSRSPLPRLLLPLLLAAAGMLGACSKARTETDDRAGARSFIQQRCVAAGKLAPQVDRQKYSAYCACQADRASARFTPDDMKVMFKERELTRAADAVLREEAKRCEQEVGLN